MFLVCQTVVPEMFQMFVKCPTLGTLSLIFNQKLAIGTPLTNVISNRSVLNNCQPSKTFHLLDMGPHLMI